MNYRQCSMRNFLFIDDENEYLEKILKFSVRQAEKGYKILILTCSDNIRIAFEQKEVKPYLSQIFIMYFQNVDKLIARLLNLHDWAILPNITIVDINSVFKINNAETESLIFPTKKDICLLASSLLNYIKLLNKCESFTAFSITIGNKNNVPEKYVQILVALYFYKSIFYQFLSLKNNLPIL
ncbi:uncharacterized protein LOC129613261 [Condylostylus longicornis]|uniref:uncharacterized protein LOC129613261 n=1 Tax=Condylostylus longicornis TaxID=2530218 RepID=UPI00244DE3BE|nr:uncharacterized protein LOC129613261 [Condylostylus longicornis]